MRFFILAGLSSLGLLTFSQVQQDANLWTSVGLSADLTKQFSVGYEMQSRFYKNATSLDSYYNEIGLAYEPVKNLEFSTDYRFSTKNKESYYENVHRLCFNAAYGTKFKDLGLSIKGRVRYQIPFDRFGVVNDNIYPDTKNVFRVKGSAKYKHKDFKLIQGFTSFEIYHAVRPKNSISAVDSYRFGLGITIDLPKRQSIDLYYILEREFKSTPFRNHIYGIQYNYDLFKKPYFDKKKIE